MTIGIINNRRIIKFIALYCPRLVLDFGDFWGMQLGLLRLEIALDKKY